MIKCNPCGQKFHASIGLPANKSMSTGIEKELVQDNNEILIKEK